MTDGSPGERRLMPIGGLARLSRLSVKALRRYDADGLLPPAWVDPQSGYRYYRADQVRTATTIALLRSLDVPLAVVRAVLDAPDDAALAAVLDAERERATRALAEREQALRSIARLAKEPTTVPYDVRIADAPARQLVVFTGVVRADRLGPDTAALCGQALGLLAAGGRPDPGDGLVALFPLDLPEAFDVTVGAAADPRWPVPDGMAETALPAGPWASTLHVGPYDELPLAYAALLGHVDERGHEPYGPIVETYVSDPSTVPSHELVTRIAVGVH